MATARTTPGAGWAPGYGTVTNPKPKKKTAWAGGLGSSIQAGAQRNLGAPSYKAATMPGAGGAASAGAGEPAGALDFNNLPDDPAYNQQIAGLKTGLGSTIAGIEGQKTAALGEYGYRATYDAKGDVAKLAVDPGNPYSRAAQLQRSYAQAKTGTDTGYGNRGLFWSGARSNAQDHNTTGFNTSKDGMEKSLGQILASLIGAGRKAGADEALAEGDAYGQRISRAQANLPRPPAAGAGAGAAPAAAKIDQSKWLVNEYKSPKGLPARMFSDGHREVLINGVWKRV